MNSYCIAPFIKINQEPGGRYRVCHWHKNNLEKEYDSIQDAFNGEEMESLRTKMLNNEYIEDCSKCYKTEELGILFFLLRLYMYIFSWSISPDRWSVVHGPCVHAKSQEILKEYEIFYIKL